MRWVTVNKGTSEQPNVRCRLVAREFAEKGNRDDLFAGTPPLISVRVLLSMLAMSRARGENTDAMAIDIKCAFLYGSTKRSVYIWLPPEDDMSTACFMGKLNKAMYGTRDAPQVWQGKVRETMAEFGLLESSTQPGIYYCDKRKLYIVSHVDDFLCVGSTEHLLWFREALENKFEIKSKVLSDCGELSFLGRTIRSTEYGIELEADTKHVRVLLQEWGMENCNACDTPLGEDAKSGTVEMSTLDAKKYRRAVARINYLGQDRPDLNVAGRVLAMQMAKPMVGDEVLVKRVLRYLKGNPRSVYVYSYCSDPGNLVLYTDSDWGGCKKTRRSTSGGVLFHGPHLIAHWSKVQSTPAPSSGEAELNAASKGISEVLSVRHLLTEMQIPVTVKQYLDASAAKGTMMRKGAGRIKHLEVRQLWCQAMVEKYEISVLKVPRKLNLADVLTHAVPRRCWSLFLEAVNVYLSAEPWANCGYGS